MTQSEARAAIKRTVAEAILGLSDELRAEAIGGETPFRFEVHLANAATVDAIERPGKRRAPRGKR